MGKTRKEKFSRMEQTILTMMDDSDDSIIAVREARDWYNDHLCEVLEKHPLTPSKTLALAAVLLTAGIDATFMAYKEHNADAALDKEDEFFCRTLLRNEFDRDVCMAQCMLQMLKGQSGSCFETPNNSENDA